MNLWQAIYAALRDPDRHSVRPVSWRGNACAFAAHDDGGLAFHSSTMGGGPLPPAAIFLGDIMGEWEAVLTRDVLMETEPSPPPDARTGEGR